MPRYIDADEFKNGVMAAMMEESANGGVLPLHIGRMLCHFADDTPTADVQEVIRCKDCKYFVSEYLQHAECFCRLCIFTHQGMPENGFCSRGERKDGE